jgi:hypothetical protein
MIDFLAFGGYIGKGKKKQKWYYYFIFYFRLYYLFKRL